MTAPALPDAAARTALCDQLRANTPQAMRSRQQWLLWRLEEVEGRDGLSKVPYYVSGRKRFGDLGSAKDRAALATFDQVLQRFAFATRPGFSGVGFAFMEGDGLIGIDLDWKGEGEDGPAEHHSSAIEACNSYTEWSPSGKGVHVIVEGHCDSFKHDSIGVEVYCGGRYFTCTGDRMESQPAAVQPIKPYALAYLQQLVQAAKDRAKEARRQADEAAAGVVPAPSPSPTPPGSSTVPAHQVGNDFRRVNDAALQALSAWVPQVFAKARDWSGGYRVTSKDLGRDLQEDLQLLPAGIMDFGEEVGMSPIDVVIKWMPGMARPADALHWLAARIGVQLTPPPGRAPRPAPAPQAPASPAPAEAPGNVVAMPPRPPADDAATAPPDGPLGDDPPPDNVVPLGKTKRARPPKQGKGDAQAQPADDAGAPARPGRKVPDEVWALVDVMVQRFALVYSTDTAWDKLTLMFIKVAAMRLHFGKLPINLWLTRPDRQTVLPTDLVFEPGRTAPDGQINMFAGLDLEPVACTDEDVAPMLDLLRHLCADTRMDGVDDPVATAMHWVLCWQALPLQQLGTKMATACVFHGAQGTGKNLYWDAWRDVFGLYGITVSQTELEDKYNGWISRKLAIVGDEVVSRQEMYHNKNRLKLVVTQEQKFPIRDMFTATRWESNHANVVFLSNENTPLALEDRDRRFMVVFTPLEAASELYASVRAFLASGGLGKWLAYLQRYPVGDFTAHAKPPMTRAKEALIEASWRAPARFAHEWLEGYIDLPVRVCSAEQLYRAFRRWCDLTGAKWPPEQSVFSTEVNRWVRERVQRGPDGRLAPPRLVYKTVALPTTDDDGIAVSRKTARCFLPDNTGLPPESQRLPGINEGTWARDSIKAFERDLAKYCRRPGDTDGDKTP